MAIHEYILQFRFICQKTYCHFDLIVVEQFEFNFDINVYEFASVILNLLNVPQVSDLLTDFIKSYCE